MHIRTANVNDAEKLLSIYAPYVENTAITFEYEVPALVEFQSRIKNTLEKYPYLVAEENGEIFGYAYASPFKERKAYDWGVETSVYVRTDKKRLGLGKALYAELEKNLSRQGILNVNACIAFTETEDEHLNNDSVAFHERQGYSMVGTFHKCGYKFGTWYDMVWMEKFLGEHTEKPKEFVPFCLL